MTVAAHGAVSAEPSRLLAAEQNAEHIQRGDGPRRIADSIREVGFAELYRIAQVARPSCKLPTNRSWAESAS